MGFKKLSLEVIEPHCIINVFGRSYHTPQKFSEVDCLIENIREFCQICIINTVEESSFWKGPIHILCTHKLVYFTLYLCCAAHILCSPCTCINYKFLYQAL